jgi:predicted dehydrogenase
VAVAIDVLGGEPDTVKARRTVSRGDAETIVAELSWKNGARATLEFGNAAPGKQRHIVIEGSGGTLQYNDMMEITAHKDGIPLAFSKQSPLTAAVLCFAKAIRSAAPNYDSIDMGFSVVSTLSRLDEAGRF